MDIAMDFNKKEIYKITNLINGKFYIGQQIAGKKDYLGSGILIKKAIKKYGIKNFKKEILCKCNCQEVANTLEQFCILYENARECGYNIANGGKSGQMGLKRNIEQKRNISIGTKTGMNKQEVKIKMSNALKGRHFNDEYKDALRKRAIENEYGKHFGDMSGKNNPMYGIHRTSPFKGKHFTDTQKTSIRIETKFAMLKKKILDSIQLKET